MRQQPFAIRARRSFAAQHPTLRRASIAVASVSAFTMVKCVADACLGPGTPWIIYLGAVIAAARWGGFRAGVLATLLSIVACDILFASSDAGFYGHSKRDWLRLTLFLLEGAYVSWAIGSLLSANAEMLSTYEATIEGWNQLLDLRDHATEGHSRRVTELTLRVGRFMGLPEPELMHMRRGALLHDIGKIAIPDAILRKPGPLTDSERAIMQQHPRIAFECLSGIAFLTPALDIPYCHHEKWDGSGYPRGLYAEEIPLSARIFAAVDIWDALTSDRPYRKAMLPQEAKEHLRSLAGNHLEPRVVDALLSVLEGRTTPARMIPRQTWLAWRAKTAPAMARLDYGHRVDVSA